MNVYELRKTTQLELLEEGFCMEKQVKVVPAKRVNIVQVKLVREKNITLQKS